MDLCLTARMMDAPEAERAGLVSRIVPLESCWTRRSRSREKIAGYSLPVVMMIKESINRAYETTLAEGVLFRAPRVPVAVRARGPEGRHGGLPRKAQARVQEPIKTAPRSFCSRPTSCRCWAFRPTRRCFRELRDAWSLSNSQAGIVGGMFFAGYVAAVSLSTALTDRIDARWVYLAGGLLAAAASAGFGLAASGFWSAVLFQVRAGDGHRGHVHARPAPALRPHLRTQPEPLHRVLYLVLRDRHRALLRHCRDSRRRATAGAPPFSSPHSGRCLPRSW